MNNNKITVALIIVAILIIMVAQIHDAYFDNDNKVPSVRWSQNIVDQAYINFKEAVYNKYNFILSGNDISTGEMEYQGKLSLHIMDTATVNTLFGPQRIWVEAFVFVPESGVVTINDINVKPLDDTTMNKLYITEHDLLRSHQKLHQYFRSIDTAYKKEAFIDRMCGNEVTWTGTVLEVIPSSLFSNAYVTCSYDDYYCKFEFKKANEDMLLNLSKGDYVTFKGTFSYLDHFLLLEEYVITDSIVVSNNH